VPLDDIEHVAGLFSRAAAGIGKPMSQQVILALSTCPDETVAAHIARTLVSERLATCINRVPGIRSTYFWEGQLQDEGEILLIIKSTLNLVPDLERRLKELHPYALPEFVVTSVDAGNEQYLEWIRRNVRSEGDRA